MVNLPCMCHDFLAIFAVWVSLKAVLDIEFHATGIVVFLSIDPFWA